MCLFVFCHTSTSQHNEVKIEFYVLMTKLNF